MCACVCVCVYVCVCVCVRARAFINRESANYLKTFRAFWICEAKKFFFNPMPHMSLTDFVVLPPGDGRSVTDFSDWDAHEARLRCPDDVSGDIGGCSARRALKPNFN